MIGHPADAQREPAAAEIAYLSAEEALEQFRSGALSPVELVEAVLDRAQAVTETVNPFTALYPEDALAAARDAEARYTAGTGRPLEGLPVAIKELTPVAGRQHTLGALALEDNVATESAILVERVLEAGGIIHARTTTPECGCASFTESRLYGLTRNPWNLSFSPSGSSGGAAASLAVGATTLASGTDSAGSLRLPAAACGVVGFKPSVGRVPTRIPLGLELCGHDGPMARTVGDAALFLDVIAGPHPDAPQALPTAPPVGSEPGRVEGARLALATRIEGLDVDRDVEANLRAAAAALGDAGAELEEVELDWTYDGIIEATRYHFAAHYGPMVQRVVDLAPERATGYATAFAREEAKYAAEAGFVLRARELTAALWAPLSRVLQQHEALLLPTLAMPGTPAGEQYADSGPIVNGREQPDRWIVGTTVPINLCCWCPAMSVPSGFAENGVPTGVQIVGRPYADAGVFRVARALERVRPWLEGPDRRPQLTPHWEEP
ncbi:MAG TPA: amidase [Thermoleophilaceae bacterium]